jgi:hypothetical protein
LSFQLHFTRTHYGNAKLRKNDIHLFLSTRGNRTDVLPEMWNHVVASDEILRALRRRIKGQSNEAFSPPQTQR